MEQITYRFQDICQTITDYVANGSFKSLADNVQYSNDKDYARLIRLVDFNSNYDEKNAIWVPESSYKFLKKSVLYGDEVIISNVGANLGTVFKCPKLDYPMTLGPNSILIKTNDHCNQDYLYYYLKSKIGYNKVMALVSGSAMPKFNKTELRNMEVSLPNRNYQDKAAELLSKIDKKIELNNKINNNLYDETVIIYKDKFPGIEQGDKTIGEYLTPKRGKNLLTRDAEDGKVPVVAGGIDPSAYHNQFNTYSPVITISASGANAGYTNLWMVPVWASDCSYIDDSVTKNVYFWYVVLKTRQKEIFDAQTGSAQAHIYPRHIADMPIAELNLDEVRNYNVLVEPLFKKIGENKKENEQLSQLRDTLLPKLMNGEIDLNSIEI